LIIIFININQNCLEEAEPEARVKKQKMLPFQARGGSRGFLKKQNFFFKGPAMQKRARDKKQKLLPFQAGGTSTRARELKKTKMLPPLAPPLLPLCYFFFLN
jgi:hypothetical protein